MSSNTNMPDLDQLTADAMSDLPALEDLLGTAIAEHADKTAAKKARDRLAKGGLSAAEREEDLTRLREWEARNLYRPVANVACFTEASCDRCGSYVYMFTGLMERQQHRHVATTQRYIAVTMQKVDLENEVMIDRKTTPFCIECMTEVGFTFNNAYTEDGEELQAAPTDEADEPGVAND